MKKEILYHLRAWQELHRFPKEAQKRFLALVSSLQTDGELPFPHARKMTDFLFELRVKDKNGYRGFYAYLQHEQILLLHFFIKKTRKTPRRHLKTAQLRLKHYDDKHTH